MIVRNNSYRIVTVLGTAGPLHFRTVPVESLNVDLQGLVDGRHRGFTRRAGAREPWYARGTEIRSGRQITVVSAEELAEVARRMDLPEVAPGWIGANVVTQGIPDLTGLPWGTRLVCGGGAVLVNEGENAPCRFAGAEIARHFADRPGLDRLFAKAAIHLRGILASVELAGTIAPGPVTLRVSPQRSWTGGDSR
jgi:hypothetical protein